jgi:hypothetical protein
LPSQKAGPEQVAIAIASYYCQHMSWMTMSISRKFGLPP